MTHHIIVYYNEKSVRKMPEGLMPVSKDIKLDIDDLLSQIIDMFEKYPRLENDDQIMEFVRKKAD